MTETITSRDNNLLKLARNVRDGRRRDLIFVEGLRLCEEALQSDLNIDAVICSDEIQSKPRAAEFLERAGNKANRIVAVSEKLLASISYTQTAQGIIALAERPSSQKLPVSSVTNALIVILHNINNPVNVGAILRSAEAAGATGAIVTDQTSDPFSPKALRGAMGSAFRLPVWTDTSYQAVLTWCRDHAIETVCTQINGDVAYTNFDWGKPCALIVGPESTGLSEEECAAADASVTIPMQGQVESLNVAVATGIILYEAARQRSDS
jgi:TrmH family RNA methyltransferase